MKRGPPLATGACPVEAPPRRRTHPFDAMATPAPRCSRGATAADAAGMDSIAAISSSAAEQVQNTQALTVLARALDAEKLEGKAALQLLAASQPQEQGKGQRVDVTA